MKPQHLVGVAAVLAALVAIGMFLRRPAPAPGGLSSQVKTVVLLDKGVADSGIAEIILTGSVAAPAGGGEPEPEGGKTRREIRLSRGADGKWLVSSSYGAPANEEKIQALLAALRGLEGDLHAELKTSHAGLGVDGEEALGIALTAGDGRKTLIHVGHRPGGAYGESYVRREGEDAVYRVAADLRRLAGAAYGSAAPTARDWLDLRLLDLPADAPRRAILEYAGRRLVVARDAPGSEGDAPGPWRLEEGGEGEDGRFQPSRLDGWAAAVSLLNAEDVADPSLTGKAEGAAEKFSLVLEAGDAPKFTLRVFVEAGKNYAVASTRPDLVYTLGDSLRDRLFPPLAELFAKDEPPGADEGAEGEAGFDPGAGSREEGPGEAKP